MGFAAGFHDRQHSSAPIELLDGGRSLALGFLRVSAHGSCLVGLSKVTKPD